jgi:hypothetical protein
MMIFIGFAIDGLLYFAWGTILPQLVMSRCHTVGRVATEVPRDLPSRKRDRRHVVHPMRRGSDGVAGRRNNDAFTRTRRSRRAVGRRTSRRMNDKGDGAVTSLVAQSERLKCQLRTATQRVDF